MESRPALLYISPVIPALTGNGLAMRAGIVLEALAAHYDVTLLVIKLYRGVDLEIPPRLKSLCRNTRILLPEIAGRRGMWDRLWRMSRDALGHAGQRFHVVHVFRLATMPLARPYLEAGSAVHLDLDDVESKTHARLAALHRANGDESRAVIEEGLARNSARSEEEAFTAADRVYVCSKEDQTCLAERTKTSVRVLPNAVRLPPPAAPMPQDDFGFLFVGSLGYFPNEDACLYLCREILPKLRHISPLPFRVELVGGGASTHLQHAASHAGAHLNGFVPDLDACYGRANVVLAPIRAGGGTRIKILEAFAHRRPVVSTTLGGEGLQASHGCELLLADTPEEFAQACLTLIQNPEVAASLAARARQLVAREYSLNVLADTVRDGMGVEPGT